MFARLWAGGRDVSTSMVAFMAVAVVGVAGGARAASITVVNPANWGNNMAIGLGGGGGGGGGGGVVTEDFEDAALAPGLRISVTPSAGGTLGYGPTNSLPFTFSPTTDDPNPAKVFSPGVWDGTRGLLNIAGPVPVGYQSLNWGDVTFQIGGAGATAFGFSIEQADLPVALYVNDVLLSPLAVTPGPGRNGYVRINAAPGEVIHSVRLDNATSATTGDGWMIDHVAFRTAPTPVPLPAAACGGLALLGLLAGGRLVRRSASPAAR